MKTFPAWLVAALVNIISSFVASRLSITADNHTGTERTIGIGDGLGLMKEGHHGVPIFERYSYTLQRKGSIYIAADCASNAIFHGHRYPWRMSMPWVRRVSRSPPHLNLSNLYFPQIYQHVPCIASRSQISAVYSFFLWRHF